MEINNTRFFLDYYIITATQHALKLKLNEFVESTNHIIVYFLKNLLQIFTQISQPKFTYKDIFLK